MRTFTGGISLSPPLQMLKEKLMIEQDEILTFSPTMVFIPLAQHIGCLLYTSPSPRDRG